MTKTERPVFDKFNSATNYSLRILRAIEIIENRKLCWKVSKTYLKTSCNSKCDEFNIIAPNGRDKSTPQAACENLFVDRIAMKREASATRRAQNSLSKMVASFEQGDKYAETVTKAVTDGATQAVEETVQAGTKAIDEVAKKSAKSIEKLEQAANARAKRFMRITKPEVMVNIAIWIAVAVASAIILSFCYEFFTK